MCQFSPFFITNAQYVWQIRWRVTVQVIAQMFSIGFKSVYCVCWKVTLTHISGWLKGSPQGFACIQLNPFWPWCQQTFQLHIWKRNPPNVTLPPWQSRWYLVLGWMYFSPYIELCFQAKELNCCQTKNVLPNCLRFCPIAFTWFKASLSQKRLSPRICPRGHSQVVERLLVSGFLKMRDKQLCNLFCG